MESNIVDYLCSLRDRVETAEGTEYEKTQFELNMVFQKVLEGCYGVRTAVIFCYLFPQYLSAFAESMLDTATFLNADFDEIDDGYNYLPMFLRLFESRLRTQYVSRAIDRIAIKNYGAKHLEYGDPGTLYLAFANLSPINQLANAAKVARYLYSMNNSYYLSKFFFYWRRILGYADHKETSKLFSMFGLSEDGLDAWQEDLRLKGIATIKQLKEQAEAAGKALTSPESAIIRNRYGVTSPQFIVLHSSGAGSPVERICANFLKPTSKVTAHFVVTKDGRVFQLTDLNDAARTNRTDADPNMDTYYRFARHDFFRQCSNNANNHTVTIECEEYGPHGSLTRPQFQALLRLLKHIHDECGIIIDDYHVIGHGDIAPLTRGYCPGSNFPLRQLIKSYRSWHEIIAPAEIKNPAELI